METRIAMGTGLWTDCRTGLTKQMCMFNCVQLLNHLKEEVYFCSQTNLMREETGWISQHYIACIKKIECLCRYHLSVKKKRNCPSWRDKLLHIATYASRPPLSTCKHAIIYICICTYGTGMCFYWRITEKQVFCNVSRMLYSKLPKGTYVANLQIMI